MYRNTMIAQVMTSLFVSTFMRTGNSWASIVYYRHAP